MTTTVGQTSATGTDRVGLIPLLRDMRLGGPVAAGIAVIAVFFGGFVGWAALAPLGSAAIAPGVVSVESNRKTIQHLEGGIVFQIAVRDGDKVDAGDVLVVLDDTQARAALELVRGRQIAALALKARLEAEQADRTQIQFPENLRSGLRDSKVAEMVHGQISIFEARRKALTGSVGILKQQISQLAEEIKGLRGQIDSENRQLGLITDEISDISGLVRDGVVPRPRLRKLQRDAAEIEGSLRRNQARIAQVNQTIAEKHLQINELTTTRMNEVVTQMRDVRTELFDLAERERATEDVLRRTVIRAPIGGTVVNLQVHTKGGVVASGAPLLDIVPSEDRLIIEARVNPSDIDVVYVGLPAQARFTAFSQRNAQPVDGTVIAVSADSLTNQRTGETYYLARIEVKDNLRAKLGGADLYPGMQAEIMIATGERTALEYFLKPIVSSLNRAFRED